MDILSRAFDHRINSYNLYLELAFGEYLDFAEEIIANNEFQRKRVRTSKTVYSLLKSDLKAGCIMPPLVLAIVGDSEINPKNITSDELLGFIKQNTSQVLILDGLQRTYTLIDAATELKDSASKYEKFRNEYKIRIEIYLNINKFGVLYRMLTLNTGQTPMTPRHQLEMLYRDMLSSEISGLRLVPDTESSADPKKNEFSFKNAIDGFYAFLNRNELPIDRAELLDNIKMLEHMTDEDLNKDLFKDFLSCYLNVYEFLKSVSNDLVISKDVLAERGLSNPFGNSVFKVFSTSQVLTGFGAALGRMKDKGIISSFEDINRSIKDCVPPEDDEWFYNLLENLDRIKNQSKKIGNAQRMYFQYFFRELFNRDTDSYMDLNDAVNNGYQKYCSQVN